MDNVGNVNVSLNNQEILQNRCNLFFYLCLSTRRIRVSVSKQTSAFYILVKHVVWTQMFLLISKYYAKRVDNGNLGQSMVPHYAEFRVRCLFE